MISQVSSDRARIDDTEADTIVRFSSAQCVGEKNFYVALNRKSNGRFLRRKHASSSVLGDRFQSLDQSLDGQLELDYSLMRII